MTCRTLLQQGGPAYPVPREFAHLIAMAEREYANEPIEQAYIEATAKVLCGPSLRDRFAWEVLSGLLSDPNLNLEGSQQAVIARLSYEMADAMLKAREAP